MKSLKDLPAWKPGVISYRCGEECDCGALAGGSIVYSVHTGRVLGCSQCIKELNKG